MPLTVSLPADGLVNVAAIRRRVDFPDPFSPRIAITFPAPTSRSISSRTVAAPYRLQRPSTRSKGGRTRSFLSASVTVMVTYQIRVR